MESVYANIQSERDVYIVYENNISLWWLKFLKKGFRHCYILVNYKDENIWIKLDPLSNIILLDMKRYVRNFDYINYLSTNSDIHLQKVKVGNILNKPMNLSIFSCVSFVKRFLGIRSNAILTPYQLYKFIFNCKNIFLDK
jgi:hypothetical protein